MSAIEVRFILRIRIPDRFHPRLNSFNLEKRLMA